MGDLRTFQNLEWDRERNRRRGMEGEERRGRNRGRGTEGKEWRERNGGRGMEREEWSEAGREDMMDMGRNRG